jgi:EAL domain-containing protein (putative c-di-GMP-specific phosphodiesterase class I)
LRQKATAAQPPALKSATGASGAAAAPAANTIEALGHQLCEVLPRRRLHSVSLCDHRGNILWLNEGALGPDEHSLVVDALTLLSNDTSVHFHEMGLEDGRLALFLAVRAPSLDLLGVAMILADGKGFNEDTLERLGAGPVRTLMMRLAVLMKPTDARPAAGTPATIELTEADEIPPEEADALLDAAPGASDGGLELAADDANDVLEFEIRPEDTGFRIPVVHPASAPRATPAAAASAAPAASDPDMIPFELVDYGATADAAPVARTPPAPAVAAPARPPAAAAARATAGLASRAAAAAPVPPRAPAPARPASPAPRSIPATLAPARAPAPAVAPAPAPRAAARAPAAPTPAAVPRLTTPAPQANDVSLQLDLLPYAKLRAGGQTRRFQVLAHLASPSRDPAAHDALVIQRLLAWLAAHRTAWNSQPTGFTVNLSVTTLEDERFVQKVAAALNSHGVAGETLGFEIAEALCTQRRAQVERFIAQCEKAGTWIVIDDFSFDAQVLPLLRSKAVRLVKIDSKLTSSALKDKLAQAMVVATVQAAKVLGIHCGAKKVDSQAALQWLTAIGCDLAQGAALAEVQSLDSLAGSPDPTDLNAILRQ